jgi:hypothetical protein
MLKESEIIITMPKLPCIEVYLVGGLEYLPVLLRIAEALEEGNYIMADNFDRMTKAVDRVANEVQAVADAIRNPAVDNNNQAVIDELAGRLEGAADALESATNEENAEDAGSTQVGKPTENPAPAETSTPEAAAVPDDMPLEGA